MLEYIICRIESYLNSMKEYNSPLLVYHRPIFEKWKKDGFVFDEFDYEFILEMYEDLHYVYREYLGV